MAKVSWPSREELIRSTAVVLGSMLLLTFVLFAFDTFWFWFLDLVGFLRTT
jgi:preprotein translocase SecE subunit